MRCYDPGHLIYLLIHVLLHIQEYLPCTTVSDKHYGGRRPAVPRSRVFDLKYGSLYIFLLFELRDHEYRSL